MFREKIISSLSCSRRTQRMHTCAALVKRIESIEHFIHPAQKEHFESCVNKKLDFIIL